MSDWSEWDDETARDAFSIEDTFRRDSTEDQNIHIQPKEQSDLDSDSCSSDNIPLSKLGSLIRKTNRCLFDEYEYDCECDSDDGDPDYIPSSDQLSEESEAEMDISQSMQNAERKSGAGVPDYKPSSDQFSEESNADMDIGQNMQDQERNINAEDEFKEACKISAKEHVLFTVAVKWHTKRLAKLLMSHRMKIVPVLRDGDCFFSSVCMALGDNSMNVLRLRNLTANHLQEQKDHYMDFLPLALKEVTYVSEVNKIRRLGFWSGSVNDLLPLVIANMYSCNITILASTQINQVMEIRPSFAVHNEPQKITLAYSAIPGREHYDVCVPQETCDASGKQETQQLPPLQDLVPNGERTTNENSEVDMKPTLRQSITPKKKLVTTPYKGTSTDKEPCVTPRKSATYNSPKRMKTTRKRIAAPETWKKNKRKISRSQGKSYTSAKGKTVAAKLVQPKDCSKCPFRCTTNITENDREELCQSYWQLASYERQNDFIINSVEEKETKRKKGQRRKYSRLFSFLVSGERIRVCKGFFLSTLGITDKKVRVATQKRRTGTHMDTDRRGKHIPHNKTAQDRLDGVRKHIESFPTVESHYSRQNSNRKYLATDLSIAKMYNLYVETCKDTVAVSERVYRRTFNREYNFYFHKPKKDQCELCHKYHQQTSLGTCDSSLENKFADHQRRKEEARQEKETMKETAQTHSEIYVATFDMQAVLSTPCSLVSQVYYKRKLSTYNLSFYSLGDKVGTCFLWNECHGGRGSSEVATCILKHLQNLPQSVRYVSLFSDTCTGQNRNQYVTTALHHALMSIDHLQVVEQKFLEPGHTQMECDSMHSAIEHAKKRTSIFEPSQWDTVVQMARKNNPYLVVPLSYSDFLDFGHYAKRKFPNLVYDISGRKIAWMKIKVIQVRKESPGTLYIKYGYNEDFITVNTHRRKQRGRPSTPKNENEVEGPKQKYSAKLPISFKKKEDLLSLCKSGVIPPVHHDFYMRLPCSNSVRDKLPEPDVMEEETEPTT